MTEKKKNLSDVGRILQTAAKMRFALAVSQWNSEVTYALRDGAVATLLESGADSSNIEVFEVPGSFELSAAAEMLAQTLRFDAVICLGCVIQGETRHFDFICNAVANGIAQVGIKHALPVIFGVLTTNTMQQALDRSGGKHGNKGIEAAATAISMVALNQSLR
jgi:6,7-dimethyl-8-ribityllumazine synthase